MEHLLSKLIDKSIIISIVYIGLIHHKVHHYVKLAFSLPYIDYKK